MLAVLDPVPEHIDDAALTDLALQAREELLARRAVVIEIERRDKRRLRHGDEGAKLDKIDRPRPIIGRGIAQQPIVKPDEGFRVLGEAAAAWRQVQPIVPATIRASKPLFRGISFHAAASHPFARRVSNAMPIWRGEKRFLRSLQA